MWLDNNKVTRSGGVTPRRPTDILNTLDKTVGLCVFIWSDLCFLTKYTVELCQAAKLSFWAIYIENKKIFFQVKNIQLVLVLGKTAIKNVW